MSAEVCRLVQVQHFMTGENRFVLIIEPRAASARPKKSHVADWMNAHQDLVKRHCIGVAIVVTNSFVRILIAGILLLLRRSVEYSTFKSTAEAFSWARGQVAKRPSQSRS
jgi:hypothetical protein